MEENYYVIGVMSGTSLDGVDLCYVRFSKENIANFSILKTQTIPYSKQRKKTLQHAFFANASDLQSLDKSYGEWLGKCTQTFIKNNQIKKLDLIASHGHTIHHRPEKGYTLQIGSGAAISKITGTTTVCDFRSQDVQLGGQGAPLVPIGDELLFKDYDACLNLGGFANISTKSNDQRIAFDICPINVMLNTWAEQLGKAYDKNGEMARQGAINPSLLADLNALSFYKKKPPKSLGVEIIDSIIQPVLKKHPLSTYDYLRTWIAHSTDQISACLPSSKKHRTLITGGGTFNDFLIEKLNEKTTSQLIVPDPLLVDYKEALIFALLGILKIQGKTNCLASVTGAKKDHSSGEIFIP